MQLRHPLYMYMYLSEYTCRILGLRTALSVILLVASIQLSQDAYDCPLNFCD